MRSEDSKGVSKVEDKKVPLSIEEEKKLKEKIEKRKEKNKKKREKKMSREAKDEGKKEELVSKLEKLSIG